MQAVNICLQAQKTEYLQRIREWQASLKCYDEAVKLDVLRLSLLKDAGVHCASEVISPDRTGPRWPLAFRNYTACLPDVQPRARWGFLCHTYSKICSWHAGTVSFETLHENSSIRERTSGYFEQSTGGDV